MAVVRRRGLGNAGRVYGFGLGRTPDDIGRELYPSYSGEWAWAYAELAAQLGIDIGSLPPGTTLGQLVANGTVSQAAMNAALSATGYGDPANHPEEFATFAPANIDQIGPVSQAAFNAAAPQITGRAPAPAPPPPPSVYLVDGLTVDGNGTPLDWQDPNYYNALLDLILQSIQAGATPGTVTTQMAALAKQNPKLVTSLPPSILSKYQTALVAFGASAPATQTSGPTSPPPNTPNTSSGAGGGGGSGGSGAAGGGTPPAPGPSAGTLNTPGTVTTPGTGLTMPGSPTGGGTVETAGLPGFVSSPWFLGALVVGSLVLGSRTARKHGGSRPR